MPGFLAGHILSARILFGVFLQALSALKHKVLGEFDFFFVDAVQIDYRAVVVGHRYDLSAQLVDLFNGMHTHIAGAGDNAGFALEAFASGGEHFLREVNQTVAGGFGADKAAAPVKALAGKHAFKPVIELFVLAKHIADFASAHADISGGHIGIGTDVTEEFAHKRLAETHHFIVGLASGVKVRTALAAAHGQTGKAVFENLFKTEKFENA